MSSKTKFMLTQNSKIAKMSGEKTYNFGIPAFMNKDGFRTCPMAGQCAKGCYAKQGAYVWSNVAQAFERRLEATKTQAFVSEMNDEIRRRKITRVRVHDSGDFYSDEYLNKWLRIAAANPSVKFYAYTKMVQIVKRHRSLGLVPPNFTFIFSFGGKQDTLIDPATDRHSRVFPDLASLLKAGYSDTSEDDSQATGPNHRIGLIYHGAKGKAWTA